MAPSIPSSAAYPKAQHDDESTESESEEYGDWKYSKSSRATKKDGAGGGARKSAARNHHAVVDNVNGRHPARNRPGISNSSESNVIDLVSDDDSGLPSTANNTKPAARSSTTLPSLPITGTKNYDSHDSPKSTLKDLKKSPSEAMASSTDDEQYDSEQESYESLTVASAASTPNASGCKPDAKKVWTDGCLRPTHITKKPDGTYTQPQGRPPYGFVWDAQRGLYVPTREARSSTFYGSAIRSGEQKSPAITKNTESRTTRANNRKRAAESSKIGDSPVSIANVRKKPPTEGLNSSTDEEEEGKETTDRNEERKRRWTDDGCLRPTKENRKKAHDGSYIRPPGRCPEGMTWDPQRGVYAPVRPQKRHRADTSSPVSPPGSSRAVAMSSESEHVEEDEEPGAKLGTRVHAKFTDGDWYWATIVDIKGGPNDTSKRYSVRFSSLLLLLIDVDPLTSFACLFM